MVTSNKFLNKNPGYLQEAKAATASKDDDDDDVLGL